MIGFSNPMVTTRNGRPSERSTMLMGTPSRVVAESANRKAKTELNITVAANHAFDPRRRIERKSDTKVRCIDRYPSTMMMMSRVSAF